MKLERHLPRILVVEDEALLRLDLACALGDAGFDVVEVSNAKDALAALSATSEIEVMITDVQLVGSLDGAKLSWMVRHKWPPIHIFVVSGHYRAWELELPERIQFFAKPLQTDRLINAVHASLGTSH